MQFQYDKNDRFSIEAHSKKLIGSCLRDCLSEEAVQIIKSKSKAKGKKTKGKGYFGNLIEEFYFGIKPNNRPIPDFPVAGVELKTFPLKKLKNGELAPKERLVLNIIDFNKVVNETWETSSFLKKNSLLLLIFYLFAKGVLPLDYLITLANLWEFPKNDLRIIRQDWQYIVDKIKAKKAHELSEGDTYYLGACTKGKDSSSMRSQLGSSIPAKQRAFALKAKYLKMVLETLAGPSPDVEPIIKDIFRYPIAKTFEQIVAEKFEPYIGKTVGEIDDALGYRLNKKTKDYYARLARAMLGIKKRRIEEFDKADVVMKIIRLNKDGMPKESMSFPAIRYKYIIKEKWGESELRDMFTKKFFFVVFRYVPDDKLRLEKVMFWNMPYFDLKNHARPCWLETVRRIKAGRAEDLPKMSEDTVCHVRPHGRDSRDTYETHYGKKVKKQSFWLNARYLKEQIAKIIG